MLCTESSAFIMRVIKRIVIDSINDMQVITIDVSSHRPQKHVDKIDVIPIFTLHHF